MEKYNYIVIIRIKNQYFLLNLDYYLHNNYPMVYENEMDLIIFYKLNSYHDLNISMYQGISVAHKTIPMLIMSSTDREILYERNTLCSVCLIPTIQISAGSDSSTIVYVLSGGKKIEMACLSDNS